MSLIRSVTFSCTNLENISSSLKFSLAMMECCKNWSFDYIIQKNIQVVTKVYLTSLKYIKFMFISFFYSSYTSNRVP